MYKRKYMIESLERYDKLLEDVSYQLQSNKLRSNVENDFKAIIQHKVLSELKLINIDNLKNFKQHIRVSVLKSHGYLTYQDIYVAKIEHLASLTGISFDTAEDIHYHVLETAKDIGSKTKIKIDKNVKDKETTKLLKSIEEYNLKSPFYLELKQLKQSLKSYIEKKNKFSDNLKMFTWLFKSKEKKAKFIEEFLLYEEQIVSHENSNIRIKSKVSKRFNPTNDELWDNFNENSIIYYTTLDKLNININSNEEEFYGLTQTLGRKIQDQVFFPEGLLVTLRRYQEFGVKYILSQGKVLLGDDMGLGKTIQAIATMVSLKNTGSSHFVVISPLSVVTNWSKEITTHSKLKSIIAHGKNKTDSIKAWKDEGGVLVTNFETAKLPIMNEIDKIDLLVVDECHFIKNIKAQRTKAVIELITKSERVLFMSGTALENKLDEMTELVSFINSDVANKLRINTNPISYKNALEPVYYRRRKEIVLTELPDKQIIEEWIDLNDLESNKYKEDLLSEEKPHFMTLRRLSFDIGDIKNSSKIERIIEIVEESKSANRKVLIFTYFKENIKLIQEALGEIACRPITGSVSSSDRLKIIDDLKNNKEKHVLIGQIDACGTGLNIQCASVVILCEPQLKPSIENQAIARVDRMGQTEKVLIYRLLVSDTIEERLYTTLLAKQKLFNDYANESNAADMDLETDNHTITNLIETEIDRIKNSEKNNKKSVSVVKSESLNDKKDYYNELLSKDYDSIIELLLKKHGDVYYNYFTDESCNSKKKNNSLTSSGLYIHHIKEDIIPKLSDKNVARLYSFNYQKSYNLVYCNLLEHIILHIKIFEKNKYNLSYLQGLIIFLIPQANDYYSEYNFKASHHLSCKKVIENDFDSYIDILNYFKMIYDKNSGKILNISTLSTMLSDKSNYNIRVENILRNKK